VPRGYVWPYFMPRYIVVAEKSSVAKALRRVLVRLERGVTVSYVRGHLMDLDLPERFTRWRLSDLPEIFRPMEPRTIISDSASYRSLRRLFSEQQDGELVIATDNDPEGELIGYEILSVYLECRGRAARYWRMRFNSLEDEELAAAWRRLEPELRWGWVHKADFRRSFDLLSGAVFTRLITLSTRKYVETGVLSWGPVQSPCLNFLVEREQEIKRFKPQKYWYIACLLESSGGRFLGRSERFWNRGEAEESFRLVRESSAGLVEDYEERSSRVPRPLPAATDDALRDLVRITGRSSYSLMQILEDLYRGGYISYPRTETNRYPGGFDFEKRRKVVQDSGILRDLEIKGPASPRNGEKDDGAHPPIYPTAPLAGAGIRKTVWEYLARRFVANAYMGDALQILQSAEVVAGGVVLHASGRYFKEEGFLLVFPYFKPREERLPQLARGERVAILEARLVEEETRPPPRLSEAELLRMMESRGLGTDATRPIYPSLLLSRGYIARSGRALKPTHLGESLIQALSGVDPRLVTPETRRSVEGLMREIEQGKMTKMEALRRSIELYRPTLENCLSVASQLGELLGRSIARLGQNGGRGPRTGKSRARA
jgi:DNA topoisomerase-1